MGAQENLQIIKEGYAAYGRGDMAGLLDKFSQDIEWQIPGTGLPLAGTYRGHAGVTNFFQKLAQEAEVLDFQPREFIAEGDRVIVLGTERTKIRATNRTVDLDWIMSFTMRNGKVVSFREYTDTKVLADAYESSAAAAG